MYPEALVDHFLFVEAFFLRFLESHEAFTECITLSVASTPRCCFETMDARDAASVNMAR